MNFGLSEEQEQLRDTVREYLAAEAPVTYARAMMDDARGFTDDAWRGMAELGWMGLTVPERFGGSGLGLLDLAIVMEAAGTVVLPGPFASTVALGLPALVAAADEEQAGRVLPEVAAGRLRLTAAIAEAPGLWHARGIAAAATPAGEGFELGGEKLFVPDARSADLVIVAARLGEGLGLFAVPAADLRIEPLATVDTTRKLDAVVLDGVRVGRDALLGGTAVAPAVLDAVVDAAKVALAAEMAGCAERALALAVEYAGVREQFGRAIGSFQAIQHQCADMKVDVENAKSLVYYAAWALDSGVEDARLAAAMAKVYASDACPRVVGQAIQVHGGIGYTWEHDLHLFFKRTKADEVTYGDAAENREQVAALLGLSA